MQKDMGDASTSAKFNHPYEPYDIQLELMQAIFSCIQDGCIGIFESPTGTGKSLSLICSSMTWLRQHKPAELERKLKDLVVSNTGDPGWLVERARNVKLKELSQQHEQLELRLKEVRKSEARLRKESTSRQHYASKRRKPDAEVEEVDFGQFELEDYEAIESGKKNPEGQSFSSSTAFMLEQLGMQKKTAVPDLVLDDELKIIFSSRTHSQLSQFVSELRRVKLPASSLTARTENYMVTHDEEEAKHVSLGSRKNLCIHPSVSKLRSPTAINETCLELQKPSSSRKCSFIPSADNVALSLDFRDHTLARIRDIEELHDLGKSIGICPYYASRSVIPPSEIVTLPYPLLLQKSAREALSLDITGQVVIIDEAHNLMDSILGLYSISVSNSQIQLGKAQLLTYLQKYKSRLKGKNRIFVAQTIRLLDSLSAALEQKLGLKQKDGLVSMNDLLSGKGVDQINLHELLRYLEESKLARKVDGYCAYLKEEQAKTGKVQNVEDRSVPVLTHLQGFLLALTSPSEEGKLFFEKGEDSRIFLKFMLLDPSYHFREIVENARAVVLAGGTMSPISDYINQLFYYVPTTRIRTLSCGHVIPPTNILAHPVVQGEDGFDFEFTFEKRNSLPQVEQLGKTLIRIVQIVPDGVVAFFPSYSYLDFVVSRWRGNGPGSSLFERLSAVKPVFFESKQASAEESLRDYAQAIDQGRGALLLAVVGGKLSEGINFSDALGRAVIMIGLPFPNAQSAEWKYKLEFVEKSTFDRLQGEQTKQKLDESTVNVKQLRTDAKIASREFYENACMRAVNQSVGRAIRHKNDFATIFLLDKRYATNKILSKLPKWIQDGIRAESASFREVIAETREFFVKHSSGIVR